MELLRKKYRAWPSYINDQCIWCCTIPAALLFCTSHIFPFLRQLRGCWCKNVSLGANGRRGWKERGPLLLFNPLLSTVYGMQKRKTGPDSLFFHHLYLFLNFAIAI